MLLDRTGEIDDLWTRIAADAPFPAEGRALIDLARLNEAPQGLSLGVHVPNDIDPHSLLGHLPRLSLISVAFPSFADGRGFSIGKCLRMLGYAGRLRASGPVISDQFTYLLQVGFDEVLLPDSVAARQPVEHWMAQPGLVTLGYQRDAAGRGSILDRRWTGHV